MKKISLSSPYLSLDTIWSLKCVHSASICYLNTHMPAHGFMKEIKENISFLNSYQL